MLSFILLVNAWFIFARKIPGVKEGFVAKKVFGFDLLKGEEDFEFNPQAYEDVSWGQALAEKPRVFILVNFLCLGTLLVFGLGLFLDIRILMLRFRKRKILQAHGRHLRVRWGIWDIFKLAIIFIFLGYILHIIEAQVLLFFPSQEGIKSFVPLLNTGIMDLLLLGFIIYFVKINYGQGLAALGLKIKHAVRNIFLAVLSYIAFLPILAFLLLLLVMFAGMFDYQPSRQVLFNLFLQQKSVWFLIYLTIMVVILGPIVEEIFFRGFAYNAIKKKWGRRSAMALTAVVFAGLHGSLIGFLPIMGLGLLLAYVYEKTGSLISSITIHILHNSLMVSLLFMVRYVLRLAQ
ncbi:MAG: CPBP family intramembrane metalloprotease [Candidatus Omnitrophica bacterium]|nr:CPBP family intramembrane metalloprotease [Candidatus Omnitrophota bacterium]